MDWYLAVMLFAASSTVTPGPNNIMIMSSGLNFGIRRSMPHLMGILVGFPLMFVAVGLGLVSVFIAMPQLHSFIQIAGVIYLLYFAWLVATADNIDIDSSGKKTIGFIQAAVFQWLNPKAWVMATGAFAAFISADADPFVQVLYITAIFAFVGLPMVFVWLLCGSFLSRHLKQPKSRQYFNRTMAMLLVISILPIIWGLVAS